MDQPDLDALEQDVESARVRLAADITRWRDPAAMSEFKDTVVRKATSIKDEVVREASDTATHTAEGLWSDIQQPARANPWAALAIGAGLTWHLVRHPPISSALIGFGLVSLLRTDRSSAPSPLVTDAVEYAETAKEWAGTANRKIKEWREHAGGQAEEALTRSHEALGRAEQLLGQTWRTTTEIATRASAFGERAVRDAETRDGLLLGAAVLAVGGALLIALRSTDEVQEQQRVTPGRIGGRPDAYRLEDAELELGC
jgi:hypothetical protein